jgi:hypothetical protein
MGIGTPGATVASWVAVAVAVLHEGLSGYWRLSTHFLVVIGRWQNGWDYKTVLRLSGRTLHIPRNHLADLCSIYPVRILSFFKSRNL